MTKREFVKLKKGDVILAIRHLLDDKGTIIIPENSQWKVEEINLIPLKGQGRKPIKTTIINNVTNGATFKLTKDNSAGFLIYKRKRGPSPKT
ncbi:MAG: hypothetical protein EH225_01920 [Calditrichaeota bacterium]|nr:hypothetical protein [Calditrichota bacterium]RQW07441.1 MAG: hypothetical protein EH225_01920 [Calditrichota bacterium]